MPYYTATDLLGKEEGVEWMARKNFVFEAHKNYELEHILNIREYALPLDEHFAKESDEILAITDKMLKAIAERKFKGAGKNEPEVIENGN